MGKGGQFLGRQVELIEAPRGKADSIQASLFSLLMTRTGPKPGRNPALKRAPDAILPNPLCCHPG